MNKELEGAKERINKFLTKETMYYHHIDIKDIEAIETVLNYIDNSIPKEELKHDLKILQETKVNDNKRFWMKSGIEEYLKKLLEGK